MRVESVYVWAIAESAEIAQLVELLLPKQVVEGSSPFFRFHIIASTDRPVPRESATGFHALPDRFDAVGSGRDW